MAIGKVKRGNGRLRDFYENHYRMQNASHAHNQSITLQQIQTKEEERDFCENHYICKPQLHT